MGFILGAAADVVKFGADQSEYIDRNIQMQHNEDIARHAAADAIARGNQAAGAARMKATQLQGEQSVAYANSGVDSTAGTAGQTQTQTAVMADLDARTIENNAAREAWGFKRTEENIASQRRQEDSAHPLKQASSILSGSSRVIGGGMSFGGS